MTEDSAASLEEAFSSPGRIRILSLLSQIEELHLTEISKRTDQSYTATERHLKALQKAALVEEKDYGRVRIFNLKLENPRAKMLRDLILQWNHSHSRNVEAQA